jgi:enamine deaminase RidA (YjgF/YER057c/UK114 family)
MITRSTPDVGYMSSVAFSAINVSHIVKAGGFVYLSGVVAAQNDEPVALNDPAGQVRCVLDNVERLLASEGLGWENLVASTIYSPVLAEIQAQLDQFAERFRGNPPCLTMIGVSKLAAPEFLLEMTVVAFSD